MKAIPIIALIGALLGGATPAGAETPCLRSDDPLVSKLVARGLDGSATFRRLYERLKQSNLIVHLQRATHLRAGSGYNQFITHAGSYRFVRITLNVVKEDDDGVALLGHELQHAVELAEAPTVEDGADYEQLFERIGYESCSPVVRRCFETDAAVRAGRDVLRELRTKGTSAVRQPFVRNSSGAR